MPKIVNGNSSASVIKNETLSDDEDVPLSKLVHKNSTESDDDVPKKNRKRQSKALDRSSQPEHKRIKKEKDIKTEKKASGRNSDSIKSEMKSPKKEKVKKEEEPVWEWWKEEKQEGGVKWSFLEHAGPLFAPKYEPLPDNVRFYYDGKPMKLQNDTEEIATFYAKMFDHEFTTKDTFNKNFFHDWSKVMNEHEKSVIKDLKKCNFKEMQDYFKKLNEERKNLTKEEKEKNKKQNEEITKIYGYCVMDKYKQKIGNFKIEPPGLFRGRGQHPKMGHVKKRVLPEHVIINCSKDSKIPVPPPGHQWKEVRHDNTVTWLACWIENVQKNFKYVMLNASSRLKGEKDWKKYETARRLHAIVEKIREDYTRDFSDREMRIRQRAVALYFIDKLALRAGNEKGDDEADTVGCCSLRVEHIKLESKESKYFVNFDFLGKDSIEYKREVQVPKKVFKNLHRFMEGKSEGDDLFDRLTTTTMNQYLRELMPGLTAKVFRTYNASKTLETQLELLQKSVENSSTVDEKVYKYNEANREVAVLCNHQRAPPKTFDDSIGKVNEKISQKEKEIRELKADARTVKSHYEKHKDKPSRDKYEAFKKKLAKSKEMLEKMKIRKEDRVANKTIALGTSKLNYLDPRISIAWCLKNQVPISKIYNKTHLQKFQWAIDMTTESFKFCDLNSDKDTNKLNEECDNDDDENEEDDE